MDDARAWFRGRVAYADNGAVERDVRVRAIGKPHDARLYDAHCVDVEVARGPERSLVGALGVDGNGVIGSNLGPRAAIAAKSGRLQALRGTGAGGEYGKGKAQGCLCQGRDAFHGREGFRLPEEDDGMQVGADSEKEGLLAPPIELVVHHANRAAFGKVRVPGGD